MISENTLPMKKKPTFSIVTTSLNQKDFIEFNIQSVICQDYPFLEHIIIDGGSTDGTLEILKQYGDRINWLSEPDRGQSDALNKGFKRATGDIIGWINSDDALAPGAINHVVEFFSTHTEARIVGGDLLIIDEKNQPLELRKGKFFDFDYILNKPDGVMQPSTFFKREILEEAGYLDESLHYCMDYDFFLRLSRIVNFKYTPHILSMFRLQESSKTVTYPYRFFKEAMEVRKRYGGRLFSNQGLRLFFLYYIIQPSMRIPFLAQLILKIMELRRKKRRQRFFCNG